MVRLPDLQPTLGQYISLLLSPLVSLSNRPAALDTSSRFESEVPSPQTPASALPFVSFGSSEFSPNRVVVAKGFHVIVQKDAPMVLELYMFKTDKHHVRVAQVMADDVIAFGNQSTVRTRQGHTYFMPGVTIISGPSKFFFLSRDVF